MRPVIVINFKTYKQATGKRALRLAKICAKIAKAKGADIRIAVQPTDLLIIAKAVQIPVYSQHMDAASYGKFTGFLTGEAIKSAGAKGTLLNHSEHRLSKTLLKNSVKKAQSLGLKVILCARTPQEGQILARLKPDFIAIEPRALIGGKTSVSEAEPWLIRDIVHRIGKKERILVGAGVHKKEDLEIASKLGAAGVLLASGVTTASNSEYALQNLFP